MTQVSQISLSSNIHRHQNKQFSSSKFQQSTQGGQTSTRTFDSNSNVSKTSLLSNQIYKIQQAQTQMQKKFEKCIESLIKQIQQKQALNNKLLKQVNDLKQNIEQSKKDIQIISTYVKKNIKTKNTNDQKLITKTSQKNIEIMSSMKSIKKPGEEKSVAKVSMKLLGSK